MTPLLLCLSVSLVNAPAVQPGQADIWVSPAGNDAWSGRLPEPDAAGADGPLRTLAAAQLKMRQVPAKADAPRVCRLRGGTYLLPEGLSFGTADSGTDASPVVYTAAVDAAGLPEAVRLVGGQPVTDWRPHTGQILVADLPAGTAPQQVFENGRRATLARHPNTGYLGIEGPVEGESQRIFTYRPGDLDPTGWDVGSATVSIWPGHDWFNQVKPVESIDPVTRQVVLGNTQGYAMKSGNRYFIQNVLAALDQPGEAMIDRVAGRVYLWPSEAAGQPEVILATAPAVLRLAGDSPEAPVTHLWFDGLRLEIAAGHVVDLTNAAACGLSRCLISGAFRHGVMVGGPNVGHTITGCEITECGQHGVELAGWGIGQAEVCHHHEVSNNHVHHCGRLVGHGYGISISHSGHNQVVHNHIHHMPRYGATIKGLRFGAVDASRIPGYSFETRFDHNHARNNYFGYNHIHHVNTDSQDTGAMETWGPGRDNIFDHNLIHDAGNHQFNLQMGIYLDDAADYFTLRRNVIYGIFGAGMDQPIYAKGIGNLIENNILVVEPSNSTAIRSFTMAGERTDHHTYQRNIVYYQPGPPPPPPAGRWGQMASNLHEAGTALTWQVAFPASASYSVWMRYGADNARWGRESMAGQTSLRLNDGEPVVLEGLPNTGNWGSSGWSRVATLTVPAGEQTLTWRNDKGGGINLDALLFVADPDYAPVNAVPEDPPAGTPCVVVQAESFLREPPAWRPVFSFVNWSDDRVTASDHNLFWNPAGGVGIEGGPAAGPLAGWLGLLGGKYDAGSLVADPLFVAPEQRDYRLRPESPAWGLGFEPIDFDAIGLTAAYPAWLAKE